MPDLLQLALLIAILLPAGKLVASLCTRFGVPAIIGELLVGIAAGPGGLNLLHHGPFRTGHGAGAFMLLAQIGGLVLMFIAGLETDIDRMHEAGVTAFLVALSGVIWPFALGAGAAHLLGLSWTSALFVGGALTATSVSISARTLMDGGHMGSTEATVILGAAVIDDVMGLFVLAFLTASLSTGGGTSFGAASDASQFFQHHFAIAVQHPLLLQMALISISVALFFFVGYGAAKRWLDPLILQMRRLSANESVTSCVLALMLVYAISAEWLGSVAGITGAYLLGYVFAGSKFKADVERTFHAIGHGLFIPLFFVGIGLTSNFRALDGHWLLLGVIFFIAVISKMIGCGLAAMARGMGPVRSLRIGCGMVSRGEVGLIIAAMAVSANVFKQPEVAMIVTVVLLTTLVTPLALRGAFHLKCPEDNQDFPGGLNEVLDPPPQSRAPDLEAEGTEKWLSPAELNSDLSKSWALSRDSP
ncbi:MAG TPA: cation:proton antiporter [Acidobacteriaceae bacterium]|jgi:Kef-type K+ transport system membrane component KefB|nr:cation:proton antiporter [Acidobacteriaceae bacterium]